MKTHKRRQRSNVDNPPIPCRTIVAPKIWQARSVPVKLVSITRSQSASLTSSIGALCVIPAAFTRISTLPNSAITASCSLCTESRCATSLVTRSVRRPSASISAAASSTCSARRGWPQHPRRPRPNPAQWHAPAPLFRPSPPQPGHVKSKRLAHQHFSSRICPGAERFLKPISTIHPNPKTLSCKAIYPPRLPAITPRANAIKCQ